jgi:hypothetical protein
MRAYRQPDVAGCLTGWLSHKVVSDFEHATGVKASSGSVLVQPTQTSTYGDDAVAYRDTVNLVVPGRRTHHDPGLSVTVRVGRVIAEFTFAGGLFDDGVRIPAIRSSISHIQASLR